MPDRATPRPADGLLTLTAADALWAALTTGSAVPTASRAFTCAPSLPAAGYVLLGRHAVPTVEEAGGQWHVPGDDVRRAAAELNAVKVDGQDLVRIGPFRNAQKPMASEWPELRWRLRIGQARSVRDPGEREYAPRGGELHHLAGIDWRQAFVRGIRPGAAATWWLPRALVKLLDAAEHTEAQWLQSARTCRTCGRTSDQPYQWRVTTDGGWQTVCPNCRTVTPQTYSEELEGHLYSVLSKKRSGSLQVCEWWCAVCQKAAAVALDHCHEHGYVRAPVCSSCNTRERPNYLYSNDVYVTDRYLLLFDTRAQEWLRHWHRCPGCRARNTLPLPHLAALTALLTGRPQRPTHRDPGSRRRKACGELRASWTGSHLSPGSCTITITVDYCPTGEHRTLAQVPYLQAVEQFRTWLATMAPAVAAAAGPSRHELVPAQFRPVIVDNSIEGPALF